MRLDAVLSTSAESGHEPSRWNALRALRILKGRGRAADAALPQLSASATADRQPFRID